MLADAFSALFASTLDNQADYYDLKKTLNKKAWLKELCTVRIGTGRRAGHSTQIKHLYKIYNEHGHAIVLVPKIALGRVIGYKDFISFEQISEEVLKDKRVIFVDNHIFMSKIQEEKLYDCLTEETRLIIFVQ